MALSGCLLLLISSRKETRHKAETKFVSNSISKASQASINFFKEGKETSMNAKSSQVITSRY